MTNIFKRIQLAFLLIFNSSIENKKYIIKILVHSLPDSNMDLSFEVSNFEASKNNISIIRNISIIEKSKTIVGSIIPKMNLRVKKLWVDALESGEYNKQIEFGNLKNDTGFSPLGVLYDLYCKEHKIDFDSSYFSINKYLPLEVVAWAGLSDEDPPIKYSFNYTLRVASDNSNITFLEIAQWINRQY